MTHPTRNLTHRRQSRVESDQTFGNLWGLNFLLGDLARYERVDALGIAFDVGILPHPRAIKCLQVKTRQRVLEFLGRVAFAARP